MYPVQYFHPEQRSVKSRCRCPWNAVHESYGRSKRVEGKTGVAQFPVAQGPPQFQPHHRAYRLEGTPQRGTKLKPPSLKNLLEAGKYHPDTVPSMNSSLSLMA